jgi:hypothetical protein
VQLATPELTTDRDPWLAASSFILAALALGQALQVSDGELDAQALLWLTLALAAAVAGVAAKRRWCANWPGARPTLLLAGGGVLVQFVELAAKVPGDYLRPL